MRWLLIVFLVSLGALLFAAAGVARHIWRHRGKVKDESNVTLEPAEESDQDLKP